MKNSDHPIKWVSILPRVCLLGSGLTPHPWLRRRVSTRLIYDVTFPDCKGASKHFHYES